MTNLTEQWNKGKLPEGDYYIKRRNGYLPYDNIDSHGIWRNTIDEDIIEVIAPVPSYEELQQINESVKKMKDAVLNTEINNMKSIIEIVNTAKENAQLKELLKELFETCDLSYWDEKLLTKIDEVLE